MSARISSIKSVLDRAKAEYITCAYADLNGDLRGPMVGRQQFDVSLGTGVSVVPEIMVLGVNDEILLPDGYLSMDLAFSDQQALLARSAPRRLPDYPPGKDLLFFLDFPEGGLGNLWAPRQVYGRAADRLAALGLPQWWAASTNSGYLPKQSTPS